MVFRINYSFSDDTVKKYLFLIAWYSFDTIETFTQTIAGWVVLTGKNMAQISDGISNPVIAGIIYWLIRILVCGGCLVGAGILFSIHRNKDCKAI